MADLFRITMLPAREGDCILLEYGPSKKPNRLLIDGGRKIAYSFLKDRIKKIPPPERTFELGILTHVDADHVEGILELVEDADRKIGFKDFWFNAYHHLAPDNFKGDSDRIEDFGAIQGERLTDALVSLNWNWNKHFNGRPVVIPDGTPLTTKLSGGLELTLLSPDWPTLKSYRSRWKKEVEEQGMVAGKAMKEKEKLDLDTEAFGGITPIEVEAMADSTFKKDPSKANRSSIAFLATFKNRTVLMAGDAHADVLMDSISKLLGSDNVRLKLDALKVSHHGSKKTLSKELLDRIDCKHYLISTNGSRHGHPDPEAIARILKYGGKQKHLHFNYSTPFTEIWDVRSLKRRYGYDTNFPEIRENGTLEINLTPPNQ